MRGVAQDRALPGPLPPTQQNRSDRRDAVVQKRESKHQQINAISDTDPEAEAKLRAVSWTA